MTPARNTRSTISRRRAPVAPRAQKAMRTKVRKCSKGNKKFVELMGKNPRELEFDQLVELSEWLYQSCKCKLKKTWIKKKRGSRRSEGVQRNANHSIRAPLQKRIGMKVIKKTAIQPIDPRAIYQLEMQLFEKDAGKSVGKVLKEAKRVQSNDMDSLVRAERCVRERIEADPELNGFYVRTFCEVIDRTVLTRMVHTMVTHMEDTRKRWPSLQQMTGFNKKFMNYIENVSYTPPVERMSLGVKRSENDTPVFTDLPNEKVGTTLDLPKTFFYKYAKRNFFDPLKYPDLAEFNEKAERPENIITCNCCSSESIKKCWGNYDCPCFRTNMKLRKMQHKKQTKKPFLLTNFSTFDPVLVRESNYYFDTIGFACSEACGCNGKCTNNVTLLPEKDMNSFELFRKNEIMGFGIRTLNAIPAGTPILEFTGELIDDDLLMEKDDDYAYSVIFKSEDLFNELSDVFRIKNWSQRFKNELKKQLSKTWNINPKRIGNLARTCCHSCEPNLVAVRVFQKGFSPTQCRLLLVTLEDIFPGVELTFDYGEKYLNALEGMCMCKKIGCPNTPTFASLSTATDEAWKQYYALRHQFEFKRHEQLLEKVVALDRK